MKPLAIYVGGKSAERIYQGGRIIWQRGGELSLDHIADLFANGYHLLQADPAIVLTSIGPLVTVLGGGLSALAIADLTVDYGSATAIDGAVTPFPVLSLVCEADSLTREENGFLISQAVSISHEADHTTDPVIHSLIVDAVYGAHREDHRTTPEASVIVPEAVIGSHWEDQATTNEAEAEVPDAVPGSHEEDQSTTQEAAAEVAGSAFLASGSHNRTTTEASILPFRVSGIVEMAGDTDSRTEDESSLDAPVSVPLSALLRLVTTLEASLTVAPVAGVSANGASKTDLFAVLDFDEEDEGVWYDPVKRGTDLYIRSVYSVEQTGNNVTIR